jgi:CHAT domain-containing protein
LVFKSCPRKTFSYYCRWYLRHVPFGALPLFDNLESNETLTQDACSDAGFSVSASKSYVPLIEQHEIVNLPSMPALYFSRQQQRQQASKALALLADPVFSDQDYRLTDQEEPQCPNALSSTQSSNATLESNLSAELEAAVRSSGNSLKLLPCTRSEAEAILQKVDEPSQNNIALGFAATQSWITDSSLSDYRILHFATHAIANEDSPEFSGLVLSRYTPQKQRISNIADDLLNLNEISRLRLNAELVVLSGCETALGQNLRGEGILGLTRGFMAAGANELSRLFGWLEIVLRLCLWINSIPTI